MAYALLAAAFAAIGYGGLSHTAPAADRGTLERGLGEVAAALEGLRHGAARNPLEPGSTGAVRTLVLQVPSGAWLSLGGDPDPDGNGMAENGTAVSPEAAAVYRAGGEAKRRFPLPLEVREGIESGAGWLPVSEPLFLGPGRRELVLEAILDSATGERVALARGNDGLHLPYRR